MKKGFTLVIALVFIAIFVSLGGGAWYYWKGIKPSTKETWKTFDQFTDKIKGQSKELLNCCKECASLQVENLGENNCLVVKGLSSVCQEYFKASQGNEEIGDELTVNQCIYLFPELSDFSRDTFLSKLKEKYGNTKWAGQLQITDIGVSEVDGGITTINLSDVLTIHDFVIDFDSAVLKGDDPGGSLTSGTKVIPMKGLATFSFTNPSLFEKVEGLGTITCNIVNQPNFDITGEASFQELNAGALFLWLKNDELTKVIEHCVSTVEPGASWTETGYLSESFPYNSPEFVFKPIDSSFVITKTFTKQQNAGVSQTVEVHGELHSE